MKLAILGSRNLLVQNIDEFIGENVSEIVSGGAAGIDSCAADYAKKHDIKLTEFLPEYSRYGKSAPLKRNETIAQYASEALVFWDGASRGTAHVIKGFENHGKKVRIIICKKPD